MAKKKSRSAKKKGKKSAPAAVKANVKGGVLNITVSKKGLKRGIRAMIHDADKPD